MWSFFLVIVSVWNRNGCFCMWLLGVAWRCRNNGCSNHINRNRKMGAMFVDRDTIYEYADTSYLYTRMDLFFLSLFSAQQSVQQGPHRKGPTATGAVVGGKKQQRNARTRRRGMACVLACHTWRTDRTASNSPPPKPKTKFWKKSAQNPPLQKALLRSYDN